MAPPPTALTAVNRTPASASAVAARVLALTILALVTWWISDLGGVSASADVGPDGVGVKTARLFNWHPLLMVVAFVVLMTEALLAYRAPLRAALSRCDVLLGTCDCAWLEGDCAGGCRPSATRLCQPSPLHPPSEHDATTRPERKVVHWACHSLAVVCVAAGLSAVWRSHNLARPPMSNLYSPHSFLGMATVCLLGLQVCMGGWVRGCSGGGALNRGCRCAWGDA